MIKNENFITIQGWMVNELNLKGNELLVFALIYGFSQDENSVFSGSLTYIADWINITKHSVLNILQNLVEKELLIKIDKIVNNVKLVDYKINSQVVKKLHWGGEKITLGGGEKITPPLIYINNNNKKNYNKKNFSSNDDCSSKDEPLSQQFKFLWNEQLVKFYAERYPHNLKIPRITTRELKNLAIRDKELKGLVKELLADGIIAEKDIEKGVWAWAFSQLWQRLQKSSFLRGECQPNGTYKKPFLFDVDYLLQPSKFIKLVTPISIGKYCLDDQR